MDKSTMSWRLLVYLSWLLLPQEALKEAANKQVETNSYKLLLG
jgi:hypothetical protein